MTQPFNNNSSQAERKQFVKDSYHNRYQDEAGGRWAKPAQVTGSEGAVHAHRLPSGPWAAQPGPGQEPPLGFSVEETPVVGEQWEIEKSLDENYGLQRSLRDRPGSPFNAPGTGDDDAVATPTSSGTGSPSTSLSTSRTASGAGTNPTVAMPAPTHPRANFKRRLV
jgi:hypothetical protein